MPSVRGASLEALVAGFSVYFADFFCKVPSQRVGRDLAQPNVDQKIASVKTAYET
jgi:hypothetical protein